MNSIEKSESAVRFTSGRQSYESFINIINFDSRMRGNSFSIELYRGCERY
ncbi:MAG: hypothetical protein ACXWWC_06455 [Chitinophagaceae bacterium]